MLFTYLGRVSQGWLILLEALSTVLEYRLRLSDCRSQTACSPFNSRPARTNLDTSYYNSTTKMSNMPSSWHSGPHQPQSGCHCSVAKVLASTSGVLSSYGQDIVMLSSTHYQPTKMSALSKLAPCIRQNIFYPSPTHYPLLQTTVKGIIKIPLTYPYITWPSTTQLNYITFYSMGGVVAPCKTHQMNRFFNCEAVSGEELNPVTAEANILVKGTWLQAAAGEIICPAPRLTSRDVSHNYVRSVTYRNVMAQFDVCQFQLPSTGFTRQDPPSLMTRIPTYYLLLSTMRTTSHIGNVQPEKRYQVPSKMLDSISTMAATLGQCS